MTLTGRQSEIIQAAIDIIAEHGIQELTVKKLSGRIGISEPALYRHFESKLAILVAIIEHFSEWGSGTLSRIADSDLSPPDKIREIFRQHTGRFTNCPALSGVLFAEEIFKNESTLARATLRLMGVAENRVRAILSEGLEQGLFRSDLPVEHLAMTTLGALRLLVTRWRLNEYGFDLHEEGRRLADSVILMIST